MAHRARRALPALIALLSWASAARAQEPQYFEPPPQKARLVFRWDALARYDSIYHLRFRPDIERGRFEVRPELDLELSDRLKFGVRAVGDLGTDQNTDNARNFDNYRSRGATIERYFVEARPGGWTVTAGAFGMPLLATEMLWDHDIQTPGVFLSREFPAGDSTLTVSAAGFYGPQREGDQTRIGAAQIVWRQGNPDRIQIEAAGSYWHIDPDHLKASYIRQNYSIIADGRRDYLSRFRIVDGLVRVRFPAGSVPVTASLDWLINSGAKGVGRDDRTAFEATLAAGRLGKPWDWRVFYTYQNVEQDALLGAYNTDDWWFHTWYRGHRVGAAVTILPQVFVQGAVAFQRRLDLSRWLNRVTVDVVKMF